MLFSYWVHDLIAADVVVNYVVSQRADELKPSGTQQVPLAEIVWWYHSTRGKNTPFSPPPMMLVCAEFKDFFFFFLPRPPFHFDRP
jgi:hypothetical protein